MDVGQRFEAFRPGFMNQDFLSFSTLAKINAWQHYRKTRSRNSMTAALLYYPKFLAGRI